MLIPNPPLFKFTKTQSIEKYRLLTEEENMLINIHHDIEEVPIQP